MWIRAHGVKSTGNLGRECVGDISGVDDSTRSPDFESQEQESKDDTAREDILVGIVGEVDDVADSHRVLFTHKRVCVRVGEQTDGCKDIGTVHEDASDDGCKDERVLELPPARVVDKVIHIDKVELVVLNLFTFPLSTHGCPLLQRRALS